jgi:hypothetical protein
VSDHEPGPIPEEQSGADLEYDLAHEASGEDMTMGPKDDEHRDTVITGTAGYDGDYSYDLAHDIPER